MLDHVRHSRVFLSVVDQAPVGRGLDLGSGGGVPGLILALARPASTWVLLDANARRTAFLTEAVRRLRLEDRVEVVTGRAEEVGRRADHRSDYQLVVARSFARPAVVAECAAPFLAVGGRLVVSEPPHGGDDRWPEDGLSVLGLRRLTTRGTRLTTLRRESPGPDRFPRRVGVPSKRPLW